MHAVPCMIHEQRFAPWVLVDDAPSLCPEHTRTISIIVIIVVLKIVVKVKPPNSPGRVVLHSMRGVLGEEYVWVYTCGYFAPLLWFQELHRHRRRVGPGNWC